MGKRGSKVTRTPPRVYDPPAFTAEENESRFKRDYEFNKAAPARSPVKGWEYKYIKDGEAYGTPPKEMALIKGQPHKFKGVRTTNSYGKRKAVCRIKDR